MSKNNNDEEKGQAPNALDALKNELKDVQEKTEGTFHVDALENQDDGEEPDLDDLDSIHVKVESNEEDESEPESDDDADEDEEDSNEEGEDDEDQDEPDEEEDDDSEDDEDDPSDRKSRKVIPIKRFHDEKRKRADLEKENAELQKQLDKYQSIATDTDAGSKKESDAIKKWADKHGYDSDQMQELVSIMRNESTADVETVIKQVFGDQSSVESIKQAIELSQQQVEDNKFETQFKSVVPSLKEQYPNATQAQIDKAREKLDSLGHSEWGHDKDLDYIVYKKRSEFDKIFETKEDKKNIKPGPVAGKMGKGGVKSLSAKDFTGKNPKSFSELNKLPTDERKAIVDKFDIFTKQRYWAESGGGTGEILKRGGKSIKRL